MHVDAVEDEIGEARHGEATQTMPDSATSQWMIEDQAQSRRKLRFHMLRSLRIASEDVSGDHVEVRLGPPGKS